MTDSHDERGAELRELFFETSQELLQALNDEALKLEKKPGDEEIVRVIRRTVHTLKGDAAACGLRELSELAHQVENALSLEGTATQAAVAEIAFAAADVFAEMIAAYRRGKKLPSTKALSQKIQQLTASPATGKTRPTKKPAGKTPAATTLAPRTPLETGAHWTEYEKLAMTQAQASGQDVFHVTVKIDPHCAMPIAGRQLVHNAIGVMGPVLAVRPDAKSPAASKQVEFVLASVQTADQIAAKCRIPTITAEVTAELMLEAAAAATKSEGKTEAPLEALPPTPESGAAPVDAPTEKAAAAETAATPTTMLENILRVDAGRIDNVLNLVGELIIGKSMLQQALGEFSKRFPKEPLRGKFSDAMAFQARVLNDLQRSVMKIRMVPVDQLFRRFPRIVRDVARQCGRDVDLELSGQETDLDKGILDPVPEPLTNLVRNAVSHGIEPAEERRSQGKAPRGKIRLHAYLQANQLIVE